MKAESDRKSRARRIFAGVTAILGLIPLCVCLFRHTCMCGHLAHGPYSILPFLNDAVWLILLPVSAVACVRSDMHGRTLLAAALSYLIVTNVQIITGRWVWHQWAVDLIHLSLLVSFPIALFGVFRGRQSRAVLARLRRAWHWPPLVRTVAPLSPIWGRVGRPLGWSLLIVGFLSIAGGTRYRSEGCFPIEREHHAAVERGGSYTDDDLHVALNGLSYDLISHSERRETWLAMSGCLMLAGGICLARSAQRRKNGRSQQSHAEPTSETARCAAPEEADA